MRKITSSVAALFLFAGMFAQTTHKALPGLKTVPAKKLTYEEQLRETSPSALRGSNPSTLAAFWTDDFSVPAHWTMNSPTGGPGTGGGTSNLWKIDNVGPVGGFKLSPINSTTKANGFATFDSDFNCSASQIADMTNTTAISCTGHPNIFLEFQQYYRRYYDSTFVFVSNNNTTWTKYMVNSTLAVNISTTNPDMQKIDISSVAGNQATVWVRFEFYSPASLGSAAGCGYSWMVDDVALVDMPANDIGIDHVFADMGFKNGGYYTKTPITQILPMTFRAAISNQGVSPQTASKLTVGISNGASTVYNQTGGAAANALNYASRDTLFDTLTAFTPAAVTAHYTCRFEVSQSQSELPGDTMNNSIIKSFDITDTAFARDNGVANGVIGSVNYVNGDADGSMIGNLFLLSNGATISTISAFIDTSTTIGTTFQYKLLRIDSAGGFNEIASSKIYTVNSKTPFGKWISMAVPLPVIAGNYVAAVAATNQAAGSSTAAAQGVFVGDDRKTQQPRVSSFVYTAGASGGATPGWGTINHLPMVRMSILKGPAGIHELASNLSLAGAFPNPAAQNIAISYSLSKASDIVVAIYDLSGKQIESFRESAAAGTHTKNLDLSTYAAGTYFYSVSSGSAKLNGKFVVIKN
jgi:hypothetical protein